MQTTGTKKWGLSEDPQVCGVCECDGTVRLREWHVIVLGQYACECDVDIAGKAAGH